jgi:hypothetical protein
MQNITHEIENKDYIKKKHFSFISEDKYDKKHKTPISTQVIYNMKHPSKASTRKTQTTQNKQDPPKKNPKKHKKLPNPNPKPTNTNNPQT